MPASPPLRWLCGLLCLSLLPLQGQTPLDLSSLAAFADPGPNWQLAGAVRSHPDQKHQLDTEPGTGILVNRPTEAARANLFTRFEHRDLDLSLSFMMPQGSNSGIYLMGRYEVQLFDSWGRSHPGFGDCGGIYQRWDPDRSEGARGYEGLPPRLNACRAPGLWQQLEISFRAPRFDASGRKIENARFLRVVLNGVVLHENVEVTGPTRAAAFTDEAPQGPLMLQGDHGPVAIRDLRYTAYEDGQARLSPLDYTVYQCRALNMPPLSELKVLRSGTTDLLSQEIAEEGGSFVIDFRGQIELPRSGTYTFTADVHRDLTLWIDGQEVLAANWTGSGTAELSAGAHELRILYFKQGSYWVNKMALWVSGPQMRRHALHALGSVPLDAPANPIYVEPGAEPRLLRSFADYADSLGTRRRITHALQVGLPAGLAYTYDLDRACPVQVWKGPFLDATPMWLDRGDASSRPRGSGPQLGGRAGLSPSPGQAWPDSLPSTWDFQGYAIDEEGLPTFYYQQGEAQITDRLFSPDGKTLNREVSFSGDKKQAPFLRLATAQTVEEVDRGFYRIDGAYYLQLDPKIKVELVSQKGHTVLVAPLSPESSLRYTLKW